jgi:hypothetical protein
MSAEVMSTVSSGLIFLTHKDTILENFLEANWNPSDKYDCPTALIGNNCKQLFHTMDIRVNQYAALAGILQRKAEETLKCRIALVESQTICKHIISSDLSVFHRYKELGNRRHRH